MAARIETAQRRFEYEGERLEDPGHDLTPEMVMESYSGKYPELTNGRVEGPEIDGDVAVYTFSTIVGKHS